MFVVGFKADLRPEDRIKLSVSVYQALCSGRDEAFMAGFVDATSGIEGISEEAVAVWHNGEMMKRGKKTQAGPSSFSEDKDIIVITDDHAYLCNRSSQEHAFVEISMEKEDQHHLFFGIHGDDPQSHSGLVKKLYRQFLVDHQLEEDSETGDKDRKTKQDALIRQVVLQEANSLKAYQGEIKNKFLLALKCGTAAIKKDAEQWKAILSYLQRTGKRKVSVEFRVRSAHWKEFTPELIRWFIHDYCKPEYLGEDPPKFYFFLSIVYENSAEHYLHMDEIRKAVKELPGAHILDELRPVTQDHIKDWIQEYTNPNALEAAQYFDEICPDKLPYYDMAVVERRLTQFIRNHPIQNADF